MGRYQSQRAPDTALRSRLRDLANERRRSGYRQLFVLLWREGEPSGVQPPFYVPLIRGFTKHVPEAGCRMPGA